MSDAELLWEGKLLSLDDADEVTYTNKLRAVLSPEHAFFTYLYIEELQNSSVGAYGRPRRPKAQRDVVQPRKRCVLHTFGHTPWSVETFVCLMACQTASSCSGKQIKCSSPQKTDVVQYFFDVLQFWRLLSPWISNESVNA